MNSNAAGLLAGFPTLVGEPADRSLAGSFSFSGPASGTAVSSPVAATIEKVQKTKASIRAKVERPFREIKHRFGHTQVRYCGLARNNAQLHTPCALAYLWLVRRKLMGAGA